MIGPQSIVSYYKHSFNKKKQNVIKEMTYLWYTTWLSHKHSYFGDNVSIDLTQPRVVT